MGTTPARFATLTFLVALGLLASLVGVYAYLYDPFGWRARPLVVWCAAGLRGPLEVLAQAYQKETGNRVELRYGGSQTILAQIEVTGQGDLYLPADENYVEIAHKSGLIAETIPLAIQTPVVIVQKGNPKGYASFLDALDRGAKFSAGNPDAAAIGAVTRATLKRAGLWDRFEKATIVTKATVNEVPADVTIGAVDAGVIWAPLLHNLPDLQSIPAPELAKTEATISACVVKKSKRPADALRFARFLASRDRGNPVFAEKGWKPVEGDQWSSTPELKLFAGAMLRPAIDDTLKEFEQREGCRILTVYNGCGILVAQMEAGPKPDAFFACDVSFMKMVASQFETPVEVSGNQLVILVKKGNPHGIKTLQDLGKPGVRVGIGHEKQCALGVLTQTTLEFEKVQNQVMKNVLVQSPTGDILVNQLRTGSLDAVVAYKSNAVEAADELDAYPVDVKCALATQPLAPGKTTPYPQLTRRLMDALRSPTSEKRFRDNGFEWK
jgi:molybdenum ABC transporter molybdate-binding protein